MQDAGLDFLERRDLVPNIKGGGKLTVSLWLGRDQRLIADPIPNAHREFA
jgi:demethylmenaquinone methyltransferase/2-methoxy-6-polyprenyl-1,4-benzoquinol methylase/ArsR family transcriptional regulator